MTARHSTQCQPVWLIFGGVAPLSGYTLGSPSPPGCRVVTSSTLSNMETPSAFDHSIHFSVPTRQRSTFDREMAGLPPAFLGLSTTGEGFDDPAVCKARLRGFSLEQEFAVIVDKSN